MEEGAQGTLCLIKRYDSKEDERWPRSKKDRRNPFHEAVKFFRNRDWGEIREFCRVSQSDWGPCRDSG